MDKQQSDRSPEGLQELPSRPLSSEERYFYEASYKEPVESAARIEEVAKFLIGATATTSGLFLAAFKLALGERTVSGLAWFLPFLCWAASILALLVVMLPLRYRTGKNEPSSVRDAYLRARNTKYFWLVLGALLFAAGIMAAVFSLAR